MGFIRNNNVWKINKILAGISGGVTPEDVQDMIDTSIEGKQDTLTAGDNITITDENVISATVPEYTAGYGVEINNNNEISFKDFTLIKNGDSASLFLEKIDSTIEWGTDTYRFTKDVIIKLAKKENTSGLHYTYLYIPKGTIYSTKFGAGLTIPCKITSGNSITFSLIPTNTFSNNTSITLRYNDVKSSENSSTGIITIDSYSINTSVMFREQDSLINITDSYTYLFTIAMRD